MSQYQQLHLYSPVTSDENLESVFDEALCALVKKEPRPRVEARFYPYAGLSSTIRLRQGRVLVRVSDILVGSPREVLFALACILVAKLYRLKAPKMHERTYRAHAMHPLILDASQAARRRRGYKFTTSASGNVYDLAELFTHLNDRYFNGQLKAPRLSWSQRRTRRLLGHHDNVHQTIIISKTLDDAAIPRFVVEYVLYHEMLHVKHPARLIAGRTIYHGQWFREDEQRFERFDEALKWLEKLAIPARRKNRRRRIRPV